LARGRKADWARAACARKSRARNGARQPRCRFTQPCSAATLAPRASRSRVPAGRARLPPATALTRAITPAIVVDNEA